MTYPNDPYQPQQPQQPQPGYGYPPQQAPGQPAYGYPQQQPSVPGYPQQPPAQPGYGQPQQAPSLPGYPQQQAPAQPGYEYAQQPYGAPQPAYGGYSPYGAPQQQYAHWGSRVGAYLIDSLIFGLPAGILQVLAGTLGTSTLDCSVDTSSSYSYSSSCTGGGYTALGFILLLLAIAVGIGGTLFLAHQEGTTGQTPGKRALGIRLVRESTGQPIGMGLAFGRKLLHIADALPCYLGFLWPLWDDKKQTFADKIVGTIVVKA